MKKILYMAVLPLLLLAGACAKEDILDGVDTTAALTDPELGWTAASATATIGSSANSLPSLLNQYKVSVTYSSSDTGVATIDGEGNITLVAAGITAITASSEATAKYSASSASYALTVYKSEDGISWSESSCTVTYGDESTYNFPTLSNPGGQTISYSSSNEDVATISSSGSISILAEGEATITASAASNDAYDASSASFTLTVEGTLASAGIYWSESSCTATLMASDNTFPALGNPNGLAVTYTSSDENVATVSSDGTVTLVGAGTTSIIATTSADDTYAAGSAYYELKVVKQTVSLAWSESSFSVILEEGSSSYPTLTVSPSGLDISYTSSNEAVATIDASGNIGLLKAGTSVISASFEGSDYYKSASASYTLTVKSSADDGAQATSFESAGDTSSDDDISNTTFTRLVTVTFSSGGAEVTGYTAVADVMDVAVSGNQVTITYTGTENVVYKLSGIASDGFFKLYSTKKQALWLSSVSITNSAGAAINNQSGKRTFVYVEGTNTLADGSSAGYSATGDEDMKGVFFSEGQLIFSGSGKLTVTANNAKEKSGIVSDDYIRVMNSPSITVTAVSSAGHGLKANEYVQLGGGTLGITTKAAKKKGITSDDYVLVEGGTTNITVSGGTAYDSDDAEYKGSAGIKADNYFGMTGGTLSITNTGAGGKGIRAGSYDYYTANGSLTDSYITGGTLTIKTSGSESNDVSSKGIKIGFKEGSGKSYVYGGNMVIDGGSISVTVSKSEGFETKGTLTFNGGDTYVYSAGDDAINSQGELNFNGGYVFGYSTANDGIDTNCDMKINSGATVYAITTKGSPEVAIDANTEGGYKLYINSGATVIAYGGLESGYSASQTVYSMTAKANGWNALHNGSSYICAFQNPTSYTSFAVSAPSLSKGYTGVTAGTTLCGGYMSASASGGTAVSLSNYSGGSGGPGGGGPGGGGHGGGWGW